MFDFPLFTLLNDTVVELPIGANDDCYEVEDWLINHSCSVRSTDPVFHSWEFPNEQTKVQFLLRWS